MTHRPDNPVAHRASCAACGTSPVNHRTFFIINTIDNAIFAVMSTLFGWIRLPHESSIANGITAGLVHLFRLFRLARFSDDLERVASGRSRLIWEEAIRRGIPMQQIIMFGKPLEQYRAKIGGGWKYFQSLPIPHWLPQRGYDWLDDKYKLSEVLNGIGVPAPKAFHARTWRGAKRAFDTLKKPVIVKPRSGSRGRHTTTNINTPEEFRAAYDLAKQIASTLVIEEHLFGSVYRATVVGNKLCGFFRADPPRVTGDGTHTVAELIAEKNRTRNERVQDVQVNDDVRSFIGRRGYTLESVVPAGEVLDLTAKTGRFFGGYTREMLPEVHPKMHEYFALAGEAVQAPIVGFDLIAPDPTQDPDTQRWGVIEANSLPFIDLHYFSLEGEPVNIAVDIWDLWEAWAAKKKVSKKENPDL